MDLALLGSGMGARGRRPFSEVWHWEGITVVELILEDHQQEIPLSPAVDEAFQDLLAALREAPQRSRKPSGKKQKKKDPGKP